jgi:hypothetical protein
VRKFIKQNQWFCVGLIMTVIFGLLLVYRLGFWEMVVKISSSLERLRDITFSIWDNYSFPRHGYLVFLSLDDFEKRLAYSNHSSAFLFFMYFFYKIEMAIPQLPMRAIVASLEMVLNIAVLVYIALDGWNKKIKLQHGILILLSILFFLTFPDFWISAGKFNVDNPLHFQFPILLLVAYRLSQGKVSGVKLWLPLGAHCLVSPMGSALLAFYLFLSSIRNDGVDRKLFSLGSLVLLVSIVVYLQPVIISKLLGFDSNNSGWLFRSGLDGQTDYFKNIIQAIISPYFSRPVLLLVIPMGLLIVQLAYTKFQNNIGNTRNVESKKNTVNLGLFYGTIFSQYVLTCLFWPQAVSIHPYGYDYMLLTPISVWVVLNFSHSEIFCKNPKLWILVLLFLISFNFQQIAQAGRCSDCYYP